MHCVHARPTCTLGTCATHALLRVNIANFARVLRSNSKCSISSAWLYLLISDRTEGTLPRFSRWAAAFAWILGHHTVTMSSTPSCPVPAPAPAPVDAWVSCTGEALAPDATDVLCTYTGTGDMWRGDLRFRLPYGPGTYVYASTQLKVQGTVYGSMDMLKFDGEGSMEWPDGSRFVGGIQDSRFHGEGKFAWATGEKYDGGWRSGQRHGRGKLESWNKSVLHSTAIEGKVDSMVYEGEWENDLMHGNGLMEYYRLPEEKCSASDDAAKAEGMETKHGRLLRRFRGCFERGFPRNGELQTESEDFASVQFDGFTRVLDFATWYWTPDETPDDESKASGTRLVDLEARGEEFRAAQYQGGISMPTLPPYVIGIQRVENDDRRVMYDLQLRHVKNKVMKPPRSTAWTHTMEGWGFHAPVSRHAHAPVVAMSECRALCRQSSFDACVRAGPWQNEQRRGRRCQRRTSLAKHRGRGLRGNALGQRPRPGVRGRDLLCQGPCVGTQVRGICCAPLTASRWCWWTERRG